MGVVWEIKQDLIIGDELALATSALYSFSYAVKTAILHLN